MAPTSLAAQKITSSSRLPRGLAADPPPSPKINKIALTASALGANSRLKSNPAPQAPKRKNSSYNFKHTDPPGTSLLTAVKPLIPPLAPSPTAPGNTPATPLLAAAATGFTPPVPTNFDLSEGGIAQPVPVRPDVRQGSSYCGSQPTPLPAIDETKVYVPGQGCCSPHRRRRRANSGFFCTYAMDGVEDFPVLGRRRSGSGNYDEGWPLPPVHVAERGHNTPGDPRRSSMIAEGDLTAAAEAVGTEVTEGQADIARPCAIQRMQSDVAAMLAREAEELRMENAEFAARAERESSSESSTENIVSALRSSSGESSTVTTQPTTAESSRESSATDLDKLAPPPLQERKTGLSAVTDREEPSSTAEGSKTKYFDFSPSFNGPTSRKPSDGEGLSPHTRHNSPVEPEAEAGQSRRPELHPLTTTELIGTEEAWEVDADGYSTDNDDWHSIRSHMTRTTTAGANSLLYNYSMATPNMALPTPEELQAQWEARERDRNLYIQNVGQATEGRSLEDIGTPNIDTPGRNMAVLGKLRSAAYPFPRLGSDRKGKGREGSPRSPWERPRSSNWQRSLTNIFRGNDRRMREERERDAEIAIDEQHEDFHNRKVEIGPSDSDEESPPGPWKSPWAEDEPGPAIPKLQEGDDPFHDNFATSSSASAIPSLTSSTINFIRKDKGKGKANANETPPLSALPNIRGGQVPIMSPDLAKLARGSAAGPSGHNRSMVNIGFDGRPVTHRELSEERPKVGNWSSSDEEEEVEVGFQIMTDAGINAQKVRGKPRSRRYMRPGLESRMSTVRDMDVRRASTVEMVMSGPTISRVVIQESRGSQGSMDEEERLAREAKLRKLKSKSRKRSMASMGRKKSVAPVARNSDEENGVQRRISTALQGGFGGRKMTTDGRGGIGSAADIPDEERKGIWSSILDKFRRGSEDDAIASKRKSKPPRPATGLGALAQNMSGVAVRDAGDDAGLSGAPTISNAGIAIGEGEPMRKKTTSFWRRRIEKDPETGRLPVLKRIQEAFKGGNSSAMPSAPVVDATA